MIWLKSAVLNVKDFIIGTGGIVPCSVPIDLFLRPGEVIISKEDMKLIETLDEGTKIIEENTPINIKDKQPNIGQRCNVYDSLQEQWLYAYWENDSKISYSTALGCYQGNFRGWARVLYVTWWLPERDKPKEGEDSNNENR